jgi:hypothetical protein
MNFLYQLGEKADTTNQRELYKVSPSVVSSRSVPTFFLNQMQSYEKYNLLFVDAKALMVDLGELESCGDEMEHG